jgi:hypothetical protein
VPRKINVNEGFPGNLGMPGFIVSFLVVDDVDCWHPPLFASDDFLTEPRGESDPRLTRRHVLRQV